MNIISAKEYAEEGPGKVDPELQGLEKPIEHPDITPRSEVLKDDPLLRIAGLDVEAGLYYAAKSRDLYVTILGAFATNNATAVAKTRAALSAQDFATARRGMHSLKGTAGTIGAKELQKVAKAAEQAMAGNQIEEAREALRIVEEHIEPLLRQIHQEFPPTEEELS